MNQPPLPARPVAFGAIVYIACSGCSITPDLIGGKTRHPRVVAARELITVMARELTTMSFPEIARSMGRPNHSSVITMYFRLVDRVNGLYRPHAIEWHGKWREIQDVLQEMRLVLKGQYAQASGSGANDGSGDARTNPNLGGGACIACGQGHRDEQGGNQADGEPRDIAHGSNTEKRGGRNGLRRLVEDRARRQATENVKAVCDRRESDRLPERGIEPAQMRTRYVQSRRTECSGERPCY